MDWPLWYAAARAGNPDAVLTFNDGCFCVGNVTPVVPEHDYLSGETEMLIGGRVRLGRGRDAHASARGPLCARHPLPVAQPAAHRLFLGPRQSPPAWLPGQPYAAAPATGGALPMEPPIYDDAELHGFLRAAWRWAAQ